MAPIRVLIVDDEPELVSALEERLEIRGFDAKGVLDGSEAIALAESRTFDVAVVDLKMPGMSGLEVIRELKSRQPGIRCILLTGHGAAENPVKGRECGADACVMKPLDIEILTKMLREAASEGR